MIGSLLNKSRFPTPVRISSKYHRYKSYNFKKVNSLKTPFFNDVVPTAKHGQGLIFFQMTRVSRNFLTSGFCLIIFETLKFKCPFFNFSKKAFYYIIYIKDDQVCLIFVNSGILTPKSFFKTTFLSF